MSIEAMKQALEALELLAKYENPLTKWQVRKPRDGGPMVTVYPHQVASDAAIVLRTAIAEAEQEPWGWRWKERINGEVDNWVVTSSEPPPYAVEQHPLYTVPQPAQQPLTDEQIMSLCAAEWASHPIEVARVIEAAHGIGEKK